MALSQQIKHLSSNSAKGQNLATCPLCPKSHFGIWGQRCCFNLDIPPKQQMREHMLPAPSANCSKAQPCLFTLCLSWPDL